MITVHSAVVKNTTQLRLKTPVVSVRSAKQGAASNLVKIRTSLNGGSVKSAKSRAKSSRQSEQSAADNELTTTSPFIILNEKRSGSGSSGKNGGKSSGADISKVIDGNAVLSNFNVDDLSDDERKQMLTNILSVIQSKSDANEITPESSPVSSSSSARGSKSGSKRSGKKTSAKSAGTKLFPVTKANNVRIISSMDELTSSSLSASSTSSTSSDGKPSNAPIYVVLLPQNKKKK